MADNQLGKQEFKETPVALPESADKKDMNFDAIAPKQFTPEMGRDTYQGIPGDGIVAA